MSKQVLIIEDESGIALMMEDRLRSEGYEVVHCQSGLEGEAYASQHPVDVIILDVMLPGKDGYQVCSDLRSKGIQTPIVMLTARSTNIDTVMGLRLGADDYMTKPFDMSVLLARIEALLRRIDGGLNSTFEPQEQSLDSPLVFGEFEIDLEAQELKRQGEPIPLNAQEYRLLKFLVQHPNKVFSRNELLDRVWGYDSEITTRTVDVHIAWLRKKLDDQNVARYLRTLRGRGYKFVTNPDGVS